MNKRIGFVVASTLFLFVVLSIPLAFTQPWTNVDINAQGLDFTADETGFRFWVIEPVSGTPNVIEVSGTAGDYNWYVVLNDYVVVSKTGFDIGTVSFSADSGHVVYSGPADSVTINAVEIPEFSSFLIVPLFVIASLLVVIVLRRKLTS